MKNGRGMRMKKGQRKRISAVILAAAMWTTIVAAEDTKAAPSGQQIPPPVCLTLKGAWEGGYTPCTDATHQQCSQTFRIGEQSGGFASVLVMGETRRRRSS